MTPRKPISAQERDVIVANVAQSMSVPESAVTGRSRKPAHTAARAEAYRRLIALGATHREIADLFGRCHGAIDYLLKTYGTTRLSPRRISATQRDAIMGDVRALVAKHNVSANTVAKFVKLAAQEQRA